MANSTLQAESARSNIFTPARAARYAKAVEMAAKQALATLQAIGDGDMLVAAPFDPEDARRQETALILLDAAQRQLSQALADDFGETALLFLARDATPKCNSFDFLVGEIAGINSQLDATDDQDTIDRLADARYQAMVDLIDIPAPNLAGVKAKLALIWADGANYNEQDDFHAKIMADVERLTAGNA